MSNSGQVATLYDRLRWYVDARVRVFIVSAAPDPDAVDGVLTYVDEACCEVRSDVFNGSTHKPVDFIVPLASIRYVMADVEPVVAEAAQAEGSEGEP